MLMIVLWLDTNLNGTRISHHYIGTLNLLHLLVTLQGQFSVQNHGPAALCENGVLVRRLQVQLAGT